MPQISNAVGEGGTNTPADVAIVQLMLRLAKDAKNHPYLGAAYTGTYDLATKNAIVALQTEAKLIAAPADAAPAKAPPAAPPAPAAAEKAGFVGVGSSTFTQLAAKLPPGYGDMRALPVAKPTVYLPASQAEANQSKAAILGDPQLEPTFRASVGQLVGAMHSQHGIALWLTPTGSRRTFAEQAAETNTKAGPGESNHNFGRAVDIGFKGLTWIQGDGTKKTDAPWLNALEKAFPAKASSFWDVRDGIATGFSMHRLQFERVHLQAFDQATVSSGRSLVALLNTVGAMKWDATYVGNAWQYKSDLGATGGTMHPVGTSKQIWANQGQVSKAMLAATWTQQNKEKKAWKEADAKAADLDAYRKRLKGDFERADAGWMQWKAVK
jgi:hypothetical protein